ncbi:MAG TPA: hypothetical protein VFW14_17145, partial [Gaiellales bacterium]|nr:hypothetical protein [Gaiellales bacterium]
SLRVCDARGIFDGAATVHATPAAVHARANPYPVGPASYATRTGAGNPPSHSTVSAASVGARDVHTSPVTASNTPATGLRACTSNPIHVP